MNPVRVTFYPPELQLRFMQLNAQGVVAEQVVIGPLGPDGCFCKCYCLGFSVLTWFMSVRGDLQAGYYCSVCDCILRDSHSYLDHINGKYHNRALGMSMRVERSTAEQVGLPDNSGTDGFFSFQAR